MADLRAFAVLPWTEANYRQVVGRLHRQGQSSKEVDVVIPLTYAELGPVVNVVGVEAGHTEYSWCKTRLATIRYKRSLADTAVDGEVGHGGVIPTEAAALRGPQQVVGPGGGSTGQGPVFHLARGGITGGWLAKPPFACNRL